MSIVIATEQQLQSFLSEQSNWILKNGKLHREYSFLDFVEAFGFMTQVALLSERHNHHPEWSNQYNKVSVDLVTHEADGVTERDFMLAQNMEDIFDVV
ncbi:MAG: 4a-hydroxytetrahydrobiopterin dehydratase [Pseudomonadales bacterium]|nr:4a-hydroxytetrahydrobiopterin dehydratase [Pseudomonadales bacterium]